MARQNLPNNATDDRSSMATPSETDELALWAAKAIEGVFDKVNESDPEAFDKALDSIRDTYGEAIRTWAAKASAAKGCSE